MNNRRRGAILTLLAGVIAFMLTALGFVSVKSVFESSPKYPSHACIDVGNQPAFLAYASDTVGQNFGPQSRATDVASVQADLHIRRCTDPALVTAHAAYYGVGGLSLPMTQDQFAAAVKDAIVHSKTVWRARVKSVEAYEASATSLSLTESSRSYQTMYFQKGSNRFVTPLLLPSTMINTPAMVFVIRHGNTVKELKLQCGYQPHDVFPGGVIITPPAAKSCPPKWPYGTWPICKDGPSYDPLVNPNVPAQVKGPGTGVHGPATPPVDSPCGFATCPTSPPPTAPPSGPGPVTLPPPTTPPVTIPGISHDPPVTTPISPPPPPSS